ncbi:MAG: YwbE family protein [Candidatus Heimdallarchaeota archaeon]
MNGKLRKNVSNGLKVKIVEKQNQKSGKLTEGIVQAILTNSASHPWGIKVRLTTGKIGRVKLIIPESSL